MHRRDDVTQRFRGEHGSSDALGMALIAPAAIAMAIAVLFISRGVDTRATAQSAAEVSAQAAAQERNVVDARAAARRVSAAMLVDQTTCAAPRIDIGVDAGFTPGATVSVTVSCTRETNDLALIRPGSSNTASYTAYAIIDPFRAVDDSSSVSEQP